MDREEGRAETKAAAKAEQTSFALIGADLMTLSPRAVKAAVDAYENSVYDRGNLADAMKSALTAALAVDGLCLVPKEPTAKMIAAAFPTEGERPPPDDMKIGAEAILILEGGRDCGSITGPAVIEAASMCKDYRAMIAAASDGDSPRKTEG